MKLEQLISIIYKLLNHEVLSASVLAEEFQVSQRTIYRDIDLHLREVNCLSLLILNNNKQPCFGKLRK